MNDLKKIFECTRCGFCCQGETTVSLDANDQQVMCDELKMRREEVADRYWRVNGDQVQMQVVDGHCVFYQDGCTVHGGRPSRCREWPLHPAILTDKNNYITISDSCPGIKKDIPYDDFCTILRKLFEKQKKVEC